MQVTIAGQIVTVLAQTLSISDAIGQRSTAGFVVLDTPGSAKYLANQPVAIINDTLGLADPGYLLFTGFLDSAVRTKPGFPSTLLHSIKCKDNHYLADKRIWASSYANQTCGAMVNDLVTNRLASEGVRTVPNLLSANQSNVETNTTGFNALNAGVLTQDATHVWEGAKALKVATPGSVNGEGMTTVGFTTVASTKYTASAWVWAPLSATLIMTFLDGTNGRNQSINFTGTGGWQRVAPSALTTGASTPTNTYLQIATNGTQAISFWCDGMQIEQSAYVSPWIIGGGSTVQAGPTLTSYVSNYKTASKMLDELATLAGFYWFIDNYGILRFAVSGTASAPFTFDGTQADDQGGSTLTIESTAPLYRDAQYMLGATEITSSQTDVRKGDSQTRTYTLNYPVHQVPAIQTNIASGGYLTKTVGILGIDTGKDFYWAKGSPVITQDNAGVLLTSADLFKAVYIGEYKVVAYSIDSAQVTAEQALEGAGTGLVENVVSDASLVTSAQAFQNANALLAKYASAGQVLSFRTKTPGLQAGQVMTVNLPAPWQMTGEQVLIESVQITYADFFIWYDVKALEGPVNTTWVQFFHALANQQPAIDTTTGGLSSTVALLQVLSVAWTWTAVLTASVFACPICGNATLCGNATIIC